jgi:hypothetical protein
MIYVALPRTVSLRLAFPFYFLAMWCPPTESDAHCLWFKFSDKLERIAFLLNSYCLSSRNFMPLIYLFTHFFIYLFIYNLFNITFSSSDYIPSNERMNNELKRGGRKWSWINLKHYSDICWSDWEKQLNISVRIAGPRFEPRTSWIRSMSSKHSTTTFSFTSLKMLIVTMLVSKLTEVHYHVQNTRHWVSSWDSYFQSTPSTIALKFILRLSYRLLLGHQRGVFLWGFPI